MKKKAAESPDSIQSMTSAEFKALPKEEQDAYRKAEENQLKVSRAHAEEEKKENERWDKLVGLKQDKSKRRDKNQQMLAKSQSIIAKTNELIETEQKL